MIQGVLLAAGEGKRFQASQSDQCVDKLLTTLPGTEKTILATTATHLQQALPDCLAVIQPRQQARRDCLEALNVSVTTCEDAAHGMGYSLAHVVTNSQSADGWLIMLADMPWVSTMFMVHLLQQLKQPDQIIVPVYQRQCGHPVLFGADWRESLMSLTGDKGAKALIQANKEQVVYVECQDDTILRDIDVMADLNREC